MKNREGTIDFSLDIWNEVSLEGKDLTMKMLAADPKERVTAKEALSHKWFTNYNKKSCAYENMKKYSSGESSPRFNVNKIKPDFSPAKMSFPNSACGTGFYSVERINSVGKEVDKAKRSSFFEKDQIAQMKSMKVRGCS